MKKIHISTKTFEFLRKIEKELEPSILKDIISSAISKCRFQDIDRAEHLKNKIATDDLTDREVDEVFDRLDRKK